VLSARVDLAKQSVHEKLARATTQVQSDVSGLSGQLKSIDDALKATIDQLSTREQTNSAGLSKSVTELQAAESENSGAQDRASASLKSQVDALQGKLNTFKDDVQHQRLADIAALRHKIEADISLAHTDVASGLQVQVQNQAAAQQLSSKQFSDKIDLLRTSVYNRNSKLAADVSEMASKSASDLQEGRNQASDVRKAVADLSQSSTNTLNQLQSKLQVLVSRLQDDQNGARLRAQSDRSMIRDDMSVGLKKLALNVSAEMRQDKDDAFNNIRAAVASIWLQSNMTSRNVKKSIEDVRQSVKQVDSKQVCSCV
jgi:hypothetical protein